MAVFRIEDYGRRAAIHRIAHAPNVQLVVQGEGREWGILIPEGRRYT